MESVDWKKILLRCVGFGAGFAMALVVIIGGLYWWSERPKQWSSSAVSSSKPEITVFTEPNQLRFSFQYPLKNNTNGEYTVPASPTGTFMKRLPDDKSLVPMDNITWQQDIRIPPGQNINVAFDMTVKLSDYGMTDADMKNGDKINELWKKQMAGADGFVFFDYVSRYRVELPRNWDVKPDPYRTMAQP